MGCNREGTGKEGMSTSEQIADWSAHNEGNKKEGPSAKDVRNALSPKSALYFHPSLQHEHIICDCLRGGETKEGYFVRASVRPGSTTTGFYETFKATHSTTGTDFKCNLLFRLHSVPRLRRRTDTLATQIQ